MNASVMAGVVTMVLVYAAPALSGEIRETVSKFPSKLATPLGPQSNTVQKLTSIGCYDARNGTLQDCGFDMTVVGLTPRAPRSRQGRVPIDDGQNFDSTTP
jgi:hypothetical protein